MASAQKDPEEATDEPSALHALIDYLKCAGADQPRRSAGDLLREFGSVGRVLSGSTSRLRRVVGPRLGALIRASHKLVQSSLFEQVKKGPVLSDGEEVVQFLKLQIGSLPHERVLVLYLDAKFRFIHLARISDGSVTGVQTDISRIVHIGLDVGATGIVVVHNHPSGDPTPSQTDILWTRRLVRLASDLGMRLVDHIVVTDGEHRSIIARLKQEGLM